MDLQHSLRILGIDDLTDIPLSELEDKIQHVHPDQLPKQDLLQVFMGWLHEQIKKDIQQESLLLEFVSLLSTSEKLQQGPFGEEEVKEVLKEWQLKDAIENPANIRRYQMVQQDFHELFKRVEGHSDVEGPSTLNQEGYTLTHLTEPIDDQAMDKIKDGNSAALWVVGGGKQKTGANEIPLGRKARTHGNFYNEIVKIKEDNSRKSSTKANKAPPERQTVKPNFGSIASREASSIESYEPIISSGSPIPHYFSTPTPGGYICKRCDRPGHWIQLCPTNLDPKWDQSPPINYRCEICKEYGKHFATLCPRNEHELSLTQQRLRFDDQPKTPLRDKYSFYRERSPFPPSPRSRSRSRTDHSRRRKRKDYRSDDSPKGRSYGLSDLYQPHSSRRSVSPWTMRERMTQGSYRREESPRQHSSKGYRSRKRSATPSRERRKRAKAEEQPRQFLNLNKAKKGADEGRLGYDNDEYMGSHISPGTLDENVLPKDRFLGTVESEDVLMADAAPISEETTEDIEKARKEATEFLDALAAEISRGEMQTLPPISPSLPANNASTNDSTYTLEKGVHINESEGEYSNPGKHNLAFMQTTGQRPQKPRLQLEVHSHFGGRTIPIMRQKEDDQSDGGVNSGGKKVPTT
ncbi:hypothetical protein F5Y11DRAFT_345518 [Daldinia sp. FL1419]|nr:hypothetical protein F5Y11DRAFT_345518 [Daldinia sp. FL1419]